MPASLRFVLLLIGLATLVAPVSITVLYRQDDRTARTAAEAMTGGDSDAGKAAIVRHGCAACHEIEGIKGAAGQVGPSLTGIASRAEIAGHLPNQPDRMIAWIRHPQAISPGNGMPDLDIGDADARNIAAYLYTLRRPS